MSEIVIKQKRGRKPKNQLSLLINEKELNKPVETTENNFESKISIDTHSDLLTDLENNNDNGGEIVKQTINKKRGRKPKGGKIIQNIISSSGNDTNAKISVILHLKCFLKDLESNLLSSNIESFDFSNYTKDLSYEIINKNNTPTEANKVICNTNENNSNDDYDDDYNNNYNKEHETKEIWKKLKQLEHNLHINNINNKKSACFWCTYDFDNPPIYIPKFFIKNSYHVYGCFCSPECGVAYLMNENIDSSARFERYYLMNHIYAKIYEYKQNIKPSPNPYYILDKYYGNLSIQEYRSLLRKERLFLIIDKPLTRIMPELHEDNDDFIINNKIIPSNYQNKKKLPKKSMSKNNILNEKFGMS
jgi:hypothetical protein